MSFFPFLHFFNSIVYVYLAVYILIKNPKTLLNRLCAAFLLCFCLWSFSFVFLHHPFCSKHLAKLVVNISSIGWCSFSMFFLWFILVFTGKKKILKKKWVYLLLFGIPLVFIYQQWNGFIFVDYIKEYYGWKGIYGKSIWPYLFFSYYLSFMIAGLYLNFHFMRKAPNAVLKKQAAIIFFTMVVVLILGTITDVILTLANIHIIPNIADTFMLIWAVGVVYAIARYKFLTITAATAADNILSTMYDCLILLDMEGKIVTVNKAAAELLGYQPEELKGESVDILFKREALTGGLFEKIVYRKDLKNNDLSFKTSQGKEIPILLSVSILRDESKNPAGFVCVVKDISERKKLEEETFKRKKLESIGIFAGGIAHDFNNLFAIIVGSMTLAREEISPDEKLYKLLLKAEQTSLKAADLARKFITFSPSEWVTKEKVPLAQVLKDARDWGPLKMNTNVIYDIDIAHDLMPIDGDRSQLTQVMQNLFLNAEAAIEARPDPPGGKVSVRAENASIEDVKNGGNTSILLKKGKYVKIIVKDNGIGIPPGNLEKIFEPYFTTRDEANQESMGLGLTLSYSIIKKHNGHIAVESEMGKGSTFILYLPAFTG
ncbi:MAG: PAS domain S-box protein [Candidatus Aminicenantes bacterium]|jgi:PAS domain S-box-containing protein